MRKLKHLTWPSQNTLVFSLFKRKHLTTNAFLFPTPKAFLSRHNVSACVTDCR